MEELFEEQPRFTLLRVNIVSMMMPSFLSPSAAWEGELRLGDRSLPVSNGEGPILLSDQICDFGC